MLNIIWVAMMAVGILTGIATGRIGETCAAIISSAGDAVTFGIGLIGICAFWCGMIQVLDESGGLGAVQRLLSPLIRKIFPNASADSDAQRHIITNITANFFGLGNGATPSGIAAVQRMSALSGDTATASRDIGLFLVINSAALQLMPTNIIAMRAATGSANAADILLPTWITSIASLVVGVVVYALCMATRGSPRRGSARRGLPMRNEG